LRIMPGWLRKPMRQRNREPRGIPVIQLRAKTSGLRRPGAGRDP
jgi:hypothetical protein